MRWPWSRRRTNWTDGDLAAEAKRDAQRRRDEAQRRQPEVDRARDRLAAMVERALRGGPA